MRYYDFTLVTSAEQIKEKAKVNLREYGYGSPIAALNCYMDKNTKNDVNFFVYREEEKLVCAAFCYNEQKMSFDDAYDHILGMLNDDFDIRQIRTEPEEITMYRYLDDLTEGKRRDFMNTNYRFVESSNLWILQLKESEITTGLITTIEECDIPVHAAQKRKKLDRIGFAVKDYERGMI